MTNNSVHTRSLCSVLVAIAVLTGIAAGQKDSGAVAESSAILAERWWVRPG